MFGSFDTKHSKAKMKTIHLYSCADSIRYLYSKQPLSRRYMSTNKRSVIHLQNSQQELSRLIHKNKWLAALSLYDHMLVSGGHVADTPVTPFRYSHDLATSYKNYASDSLQIERLCLDYYRQALRTASLQCQRELADLKSSRRSGVIQRLRAIGERFSRVQLIHKCSGVPSRDAAGDALMMPQPSLSDILTKYSNKMKAGDVNVVTVNDWIALCRELEAPQGENIHMEP